MVASAKDNERRNFSERLNKAYDSLDGAPPAGRRASWLSRELARQEGRRVVSIESARKWLAGESMPDQPHMAMLARHARVNVDELHTGRASRAGGATPSADSPEPALEQRHRALLQSYLSLPEEQRFAVRMLIETLAGAQNPRLHKFMRQIEDHNHVRDRQSAPTPAVATEKPRKRP